MKSESPQEGGPAQSRRQAPTGTKFTSGKRHVARSAGTNYGRAALASALEDMAEATERSHGLFKNSCAMGNLIAGGELEETYVVSELLRAADARGVNRRKAERTIERGLDRGQLPVHRHDLASTPGPTLLARWVSGGKR